MSKQIAKLLLIGSLCGIATGLSFVSREKVTLFTIIRYLSFGEFQIGKGYVFFLLKNLFPYMIFQALWGMYIYRHFCTGSVYYFSRLQNRSQWYWKEAGKLFGCVVFFLIIYLFSCTMTISIFNPVTVDTFGVWFSLYYLLIQSLWLFAMVLLTNLLAIKWGSEKGYMVVTGVVFSCVSYFVLLEEVLDFSDGEYLMWKALLVKINPLSHIVLKWHSCGIEYVDRNMRELPFDFSIWSSLVLLLLVVAVSLRQGKKIVQNQEFVSCFSDEGM